MADVTSHLTRRVLLVPGPDSGKGVSTEVLALIGDRLRSGGLEVEVVMGTDADDSRQSLRRALAGGPTHAVVVAGGDGMINVAIQELAGTEIPLGVIPLGTGNDTARALGLEVSGKARVDAAIEVVLTGNRRRIDLARTGDRYFVTVMAAGFDAAVNERANAMRWPKGQAKYSLAILAVLSRFKPISYTLTLDGRSLQVEAMLVSIGNTDSMGGGLKVTHGADVTDGLLDVVLFRAVPRRELIRNYPKLFTGGHTSHPAYERHRVRSVTIDAPGIVAYADGERFGPLPLSVDVVPGALTVLVPA